MSEKRRITPDDLYKLVGLEDPQISPDGQWIAFVHVVPNAMDKSYTRNIWLAATDGSGVQPFTRSGKDSQPRWSPTGRHLAFVSARGGKPQIYVAPVAAPGGEARALTSHPNGATSPAWSPDGSQIAFLASLNAVEMEQEDAAVQQPAPRDAVEARHRRERQDEDEKNRFDPRVVGRLPYRVGTAFLDDRFAQLYVIDTEDRPVNAAKAKRLTRVLASVSGPEWARDGQSLLFVRADDPQADEPWRHQQLYRISLEGQETLMADPDEFVYQPLVSPDGRWVAYEAHQRSASDLLARLVVRSLVDDTRFEMNTHLDRAVPYYRWQGDSTLIGGVSTGGDHHLYTFSVDGPPYEAVLTGTQALQGLSANRAGDIAFVGTTLTSPGELYFRASYETDFRVLTHFHDAWVDSLQIQEPENVLLVLADGTQVQGWVLLPVDYKDGETYPLSLHIHGGPHIAWGPAMLTMWHEFQVHAASGYVVAYCNPRASDGYGEAFQKSLRGRWHEAMQEVMALVDATIAHGWVDPERLGVSGGSYGGYLTTWILSHTDRFKAAVSQRGVYNLMSFSGTSDLISFAPNEMDAVPWSDDPSRLWSLSPLAHAHTIKTPLLILHAENDYRVPIEQAEQMYTYVKRSGGTVSFIRYPREGHELTRSGEPAHRLHHMVETLGWLDRYLKSSAE